MARAGSAEALGRLFEGCRQYLLLIANQELHSDLQSKVGASDVVQETFLDAQRDFGQFRGQSIEDLRGWMRQILVNNLRDVQRHVAAATRREAARGLQSATCSSGNGSGSPAAEDSPSWLARLQEEHAQLRRAVEQLAPDHRRVIVLRNLELKSFVEIGELMDRTPDAVRKLWGRAVAALARQLGENNGRE